MSFATKSILTILTFTKITLAMSYSTLKYPNKSLAIYTINYYLLYHIFYVDIVLAKNTCSAKTS